MRRLICSLLPVLLAGCATTQHDLEVHGALRAMFHQGQTGSQVNLDALLPNSDLYAVGALADLAGEITVVGGTTYLSFPEPEDSTRTEVSMESDAGATLLVSTEVRRWKSVRTTQAIPFAEFDRSITELALAEGFRLADRFPFLLEGEFEALRWHVIDGKRLVAGGTSHADHLAASVQTELPRARATLIGFYSPRDKTIFTHHDSTTHVHCVIAEPLASGHVDHVIVPAGTTVQFPADWR